MQRTTRFLLGFVLVASAISGMAAVPVRASGVVGTGTSGSCTEAALDTALADGGLVTFSCGTDPHTITITVTKVIAAATQIHGDKLITLSGGSVRRIFSVGTGASLQLHEMTLTAGSATMGGAITTQGTLSITKSTLVNNGASKYGGAIYNSGGNVTITDSTLSGNQVPTGNTSGTSGNGGAIYNASGTLTVVRSTVSGNIGSRGGGIFSISPTGPVALSVTDSTFSGNSAGEGGAINVTLGGPVSIASSTIANNSASYMDAGGGVTALVPVTIASSVVAYNGTGADCAGDITSGGYNLSSDASCDFIQPTDRQATDPLLGPLLDNGGLTLTHQPLPGSALIDGGPATCSSIDQRGIPRPNGLACEIGSVEVTSVVGLGTPESCTTGFLHSAIAGGGHVTFDCGSSELVINGFGRDAVIAVDTRVEGSPLISIVRAHFIVATGVRFELETMTLVGGRADEGGAIFNAGGIVIITNSTLQSNRAGFGGAIFNDQGTVEITRSTLSRNRATSEVQDGQYNSKGGAIYNNRGTVTITASTLSGNNAYCDAPVLFSCDAYGGAVFNSFGSLRIVQSTLVGNYSSCGTSCESDGHNVYGSMTVASSIVSSAITPNCGSPASITSLGHNLSRDASCGFTQATDIERTDPLLGDLADNGGLTQTHLPQPGSPAVDAGPVTCVSPDQRGLVRPNGAVCDIGAVEVNAAPVIQAPTYSLPATRLGATTVPVRVAWSASDPDGISRHHLRRSSNGDPFTSDGTFITTATSRAVTRQLAPSSRYRFRAQVTDSNGMIGTATGANVLLLARQEQAVCSSTVTINCLAYSAGWTQRSVAGAFGNGVRSAGAGTARTTFTFFGTSVAWATTLGPGMGQAEVWVDGSRVRTIDLYAETTTTRKIVFVRNRLANTSHSIEIRVLGTKNTLSSGTRVDIDAVCVLR